MLRMSPAARRLLNDRTTSVDEHRPLQRLIVEVLVIAFDVRRRLVALPRTQATEIVVVLVTERAAGPGDVQAVARQANRRRHPTGRRSGNHRADRSGWFSTTSVRQ